MSDLLNIEYLIYATISLFIGWICAWLGVAFVHMTAYYSIFGKLKFWIAKKVMTEIDFQAYNRIIEDEILSTDEVNQRISEFVYDKISKRNWFIKLISCHYCMAVQFTLLSILGYGLKSGNWSAVPCMVFISVAFVYFTLNDVR